MKNTTILSFFAKPQDGYRQYLFNRYPVFLLLLISFMALPFSGFSQYYNVNTACTTPYNDISLTGTQLPVNGDFNTFTSALPFDFQFFGQNYITPDLRISVDGYILWDAITGQLQQDNQSLPTADPDIAPGGGIFPHWDFQAVFIVPSSGIYTQVSGISPNRTFTIQWDSIRKVISTGPTVLSNGAIDFQVILYETTNEIKFVYGDTDYGPTAADGSAGNDGLSATIGLQRGNPPGTYYQTSYNSSTVLSGTQCISYIPAQSTPGCTMACSTTNISIPENCMPVLIAEDFLTSANNCATSFIIQLLLTMNGPILEQGVDSLKADGIDINGQPYPLVGQTYVIKIIENITVGNPQMCWNFHTFEDYLPPAITCFNADTVFCYEPSALYSLNGLSDCSGAITAHVIDSTFTPFSCEDDDFLLGRIIRSYYLTDESGNQSITCNDTLYLAPPSLDSVDFPGNVLNLQCNEPFAEDGNGNPDPSVTGVPTIGSGEIPLFPNTLSLVCNLSTSYTDQVIPAGCNIKILRTWTVFYWSCEGEQDISYLQTIMVNDTTPPDVTAPADVTIAAGANCTANFLVPPAIITDDCGHLGSTVITHPNGVTPQNGGFTITNVPVGIYNIIYSVNDGCGNITRDTMVLTIQDLISPAAICKNTIVSLDNTGNGRMFASSINNGSHDNGCGPVTIQIKRMLPDCNGLPNQSDVFADYIDFYCCDIANNPIMVILQVRDAGGLLNTCMAEVTVQNKNTPVVVAQLPNLNVPCGTVFDLDNLFLTFGTYVQTEAERNDIIIDGIYYGQDGLVNGICSSTITELPPTVNLSTCSFGTIIRHFVISDGGSFQTTINQTITFNSSLTILTEADFNAPLDYTSTNNACNPEDVDDLGGVYEPTLIDSLEGCHNLMYSHTDQLFNGQGGACFKIVRSWTILDWCLADAQGIDFALDNAVHFTQTIIVMNTTAPTFVPHADQTVQTLLCDGANVTVTTSATDDCPATFLTYTWQLDLNFNNIISTWDFSGTGSSFTRFMPLGRHRVHFTVTDGCGNVTDQFFYINVNNVKQPTPVLKALVVDLMANLMVTLPARLFNAGSFGACPSSSPLRFSYTSNPADSLKTFDCSYGVDSAFEVDIYVIDNNGLWDFATTTLTLNDNIVPCPDNLFVIAGRIVTESAQGIPQVEVNAFASIMKETDANGEFRFTNVNPELTYNIQPSDEENPLNGVSTGDIIKIQNHILDKQDLPSPYKIIAADVNEDQILSVKDVVMIRKLILDKIDQFASGKSWKFIEQAYVFENPVSPLNENYPTSIQANGNGIINNANFIGIKLGDVNGDFTLNFGADLETRDKATLYMEDINMEAGIVYNVTLVNKGLNQIQGIQGSFIMDPAVSIKGLASSAFTFSDDNYSVVGNKLMVSAAELSSGGNTQDLLNIIIKVDRNMKLSEAIQLNNSTIMNAEIYDIYGNGTPFNIEFTGNQSGIMVEQNIPNPFTDNTQISFTLGQEDVVSMRIYDISGRVLRTVKESYTKGRNTIIINNNDLDATGVLFYELTSAHGSVTKKMIKLK